MFQGLTTRKKTGEGIKAAIAATMNVRDVRRLWQQCISELCHFVIFTHFNLSVELESCNAVRIYLYLQDYIIITAKCRRHL